MRREDRYNVHSLLNQPNSSKVIGNLVFRKSSELVQQIYQVIENL